MMTCAIDTGLIRNAFVGIFCSGGVGDSLYFNGINNRYLFFKF